MKRRAPFFDELVVWFSRRGREDTGYTKKAGRNVRMWNEQRKSCCYGPVDWLVVVLSNCDVHLSLSLPGARKCISPT